MSATQCADAPTFSLSGEQVYIDTSINFEAIFSNSGDQENVQYYQWFLDDILVENISAESITGNVTCGSHKVGLRVLYDGAWSGIQEMAFVTCKVLTQVLIIGPDTVKTGTSAAYTITGYFSDGTSTDLTSSYNFSIDTGGSFSGNVFTADIDNSDDTSKAAVISAN